MPYPRRPVNPPFHNLRTVAKASRGPSKLEIHFSEAVNLGRIERIAKEVFAPVRFWRRGYRRRVSGK